MKRTALFVTAVVAGVVTLGFIPTFTLFGMPMESVDIFSELRPEDSSAEEQVEYVADFNLLEEELARAEAHLADTATLAEPIPVRYEWSVEHAPRVRAPRLRSDDFKPVANVVDIEDFDTLAITRLDNFVDKLATGKPVRIAFMGDSFVEGDIITCDLRDMLQARYGGRGVGFVTADIPFATVRKSVKRASSGWKTYSVMKPKEAPEAVRENFFIAGYLADGRNGATTRWQATNAYPSLDSCSMARILLVSRDTSRVEVVLADTLRQEFTIAGDERVREIYVEGCVDDLRLRVLEGSILCYGASMEGAGGVIVDNFSMRSNNGHAIFGTNASVNRQIDEMLGYDLVVLQYGLNIMQPGQRGYSRYRDQVCNMIAYAERCFPNAAIVVVGVSDRWVKNAETEKYEPIGSVDALTSYQRAAADSCNVAFWNTSRVMENLGGMPAFVSNGWAAKDYTHINYAGGKRIAKALADAINMRVRANLKERERADSLSRELERRRVDQIRISNRPLESAADSNHVTMPTATPLVESVVAEDEL